MKKIERKIKKRIKLKKVVEPKVVEPTSNIKLYNKAVISDNNIIIDGEEYPIKIGKHAVWIPSLNSGAKIVLSYKGIIESRSWKKGRNVKEIKNDTFGQQEGFEVKSLKSIVNEYEIIKMLSRYYMSPPVNGIFHIKKFTSNFFKDNFTDDKGVYGYYILDAHKMRPGEWNFDRFISNFYDEFEFSEWTLERTDLRRGIWGGCLGDLHKIDNIINNYLIDVRRTVWDMMVLKNVDENLYKSII